MIITKLETFSSVNLFFLKLFYSVNLLCFLSLLANPLQIICSYIVWLKIINMVQYVLSTSIKQTNKKIKSKIQKYKYYVLY